MVLHSCVLCPLLLDPSMESKMSSQYVCMSDQLYFLIFSTLISDTMAELAVYREDIQAKLTPYTESATGLLSEDLQLLVNRLQRDMLDAKERSTEYLGELKSMVDQNTDDVQSRISTYIRKLRKRLNKDTEEIRK